MILMALTYQSFYNYLMQNSTTFQFINTLYLFLNIHPLLLKRYLYYFHQQFYWELILIFK